jgi:hypothetical protein
LFLLAGWLEESGGMTAAGDLDGILAKIRALKNQIGSTNTD